MRKTLLIVLPITCATEQIHVRIIPLGSDSIPSDSLSIPAGTTVSGKTSSLGKDLTSLDDFMSLLPLNAPKAKGSELMSLPGDNDYFPIDSILGSILSEISHPSAFNDFMPALEYHGSDSFDSNHVCKQDTDKFCSLLEADIRAPLHCLGKNSARISAECTKSIEKTIPFVCSSQISLFCPVDSTLETTVLGCLEDHIDRIQNEKCKDSIIATRTIVDKLKRGKVQLIQRGTVLSAASFATRAVNYALMSILYAMAALLAVGMIFVVFFQDSRLPFISAWLSGKTKAYELLDSKKSDSYGAADSI